MSTNRTPAVPADDGIDAVKPTRPKTVEYAIYALSVRGVFSVLAALSLRGARGEVRTQLADANRTKGWDNAELNHQVDLLLRSSLFTAGVMIILLALVAKFVWDGKSWARWAYLAVIVLIARDEYSVIGFFSYHHLLLRVTTGIVGVAGLASVVLLFVPASSGYFRPLSRPGARPGGMFGPMMAPRNQGGRTASPQDSAAGKDVSLTKTGNARTATTARAATAGRTAPTTAPTAAPAKGQSAVRPVGPRGKSRQSPPKAPPGGAR